jgi:hypothetical protein
MPLRETIVARSITIKMDPLFQYRTTGRDIKDEFFGYLKKEREQAASPNCHALDEIL